MKKLTLIASSILIFTLLTSSSIVHSEPETNVGGWVWPLGGDGYLYETRKNTKNGTFIENTDYQIRNLDLINRGDLPMDDHINCTGVGLHRQWHAGVDLYRKGASTEGAFVHAVGNGTVFYAEFLDYPGSVIIIEHVDPQLGQIFSVYTHLNPDSVQVSSGESVIAGQILGSVILNGHTGRYPELHPDGDDSHLHFEIRTFGDGSAIFPGNSNCNFPSGLLVPGLGYTYPNIPDTFGYLNPIEFLESRVSSPIISSQVYLPITHYEPTPCVEGRELIPTYLNSGFEYSVTDPRPWIEITTYFDLPDIHYYNIVQDYPAHAHTGNHYAFFGNQLPSVNWIVDEEMPLSIRLPDNVDSLEWIQYLWLERTGGSPTDYGTEYGDQFVITLKDAETGVSLVDEDYIIDHTSQDHPNYVWLESTFSITNAGVLSNRLVSVSYSSLPDADTVVSTMRVDDIRFITHCGSGATQMEPSGEGPTTNVDVIPIE